MKKTCCFTGHRFIPREMQAVITARLEETIIKLIHTGICRFEAGGALGFDTLAAQAVIRLRMKYPNIKLVLVLPCLSQTKGWSQDHITVYEAIKSQANEIIYTSQEYTRDCMYRRNRYLVDHSSICVCYLMRNKGGTAYTVNYAVKKGLEIINIAYLGDNRM